MQIFTDKGLPITDELKANLQAWVDALRSGEFTQGKNRLQSGEGFCCLGVACKLFIPESKLKTTGYGALYGIYPGHQPHAPRWLIDINYDIVTKMTGIENLTPANAQYLPHRSLSHMNDSGPSFNYIANRIEEVYLK